MWVPLLLAAVTIAVLAERLLAEKKVTARLRSLVTVDPLTELLNRRGGEESITRQLAHASRSSTPISFLLVDVDNFKQVNDVHGHACGDEVLCSVSKVIKATIRAADSAVRWGGEEILVTLPDTDRVGAFQVAEKIRKAVVDLCFSKPCLRVTISLGLTESDGTEDFKTIVARADMNMYVAKASGKNRTIPNFSENSFDTNAVPH